MGILQGRVAIITGAGRGIGREEALLMAREGAAVVVNDVGGGFGGEGNDKTPAEQVVAEIKAMGGKAMADSTNVTDFAGVGALFQKAVKEFGKVDIVVNNAGILRDKMIFSMTEADWDAVMAVHLKGTFNLSHHACVYWREQGKIGNNIKGRIINTSSDAGLLGNVGQANYAAAKAGIAAFTIVVAKEMVKYGVTANCIAPVARTRLTTDATPSLAAFMNYVPTDGSFDKLGPQNIAPLVAFLASDDAADVSGEVFRVAGGMVWHMNSWRSGEKVATKQTWQPAELGKVIKTQLLPKAQPREEIMQPIMELMGS